MASPSQLINGSYQIYYADNPSSDWTLLGTDDHYTEAGVRIDGPQTLFEVATRVNSLSLGCCRSNDYSVPVAYGHRDILVRGYVDEVVISCGTEVIACHCRSYGKGDFVFDPMRYLPLLKRKAGALQTSMADEDARNTSHCPFALTRNPSGHIHRRGYARQF